LQWTQEDMSGQEQKILSRVASMLPQRRWYTTLTGKRVSLALATALSLGLTILALPWVWPTTPNPPPIHGREDLSSPSETTVIDQLQKHFSPSLLEKIKSSQVQNWASHDERLRALVDYFNWAFQELYKVSSDIQEKKRKLHQKKIFYRDIEQILLNYEQKEILSLLFAYAQIQESLQLQAKTGEQQVYQKIFKKYRGMRQEEIKKETWEKAKECLEWLDCFFDARGSVLSEMPDGGSPGKPEDDLRQYLEYIRPRLQIIANEPSWDTKVWQTSLGELFSSKGHVAELRMKIRRRERYFQQTCPEESEIRIPLRKNLGKESPKKIKVYAWVAFQKLEPLLQQLYDLRQEYAQLTGVVLNK
jgi:hypothetical protein